MAKTANINGCIDPETKAGAEKLFACFGITVNDMGIYDISAKMRAGQNGRRRYY